MSHTLNSAVFDLLGLPPTWTSGQAASDGDAVGEAVVALVRARLEKARSV